MRPYWRGKEGVTGSSKRVFAGDRGNDGGRDNFEGLEWSCRKMGLTGKGGQNQREKQLGQLQIRLLL